MSNEPGSVIGGRTDLRISRRLLLHHLAGWASAAAVAGGLLSACSSAAPASPTAAPIAPAAKSTAAPAPAAAPGTRSTTGPASAGPASGGTYTHGSAQEPDRFWGPITGLTVSSEIEALVNTPLVLTNEKLEYVPGLAQVVPSLENGGISSDGLTYTFTLRPGVKWHDGQPLTSKDVKFTYDVIMMNGVDVRGRVGWDQIDKVETPDDLTTVFHFKSVDAPFLDRVGSAGVLPEHILGGKDAETINKDPWFRAPVGAGPFKFKEWAPGDHITLLKNTAYFKPGQPYFDTVVYKIVPDANTLLNQLQTGEIDSRVRLPDDQVDVAKAFSNVDLVTTPSVTPWLVWMNNTRAPLDDKRVRQALAYGFDKVGICKNLLKGYVEAAWGLISPLSWAYNPNVAQHTYDPAKAKQILDGAGWQPGSDGIRVKDGKKLSFEILNIAGEQERVQILSLIQSQWKQIGVDATIKTVDVGTMWGHALPTRDYDMAYSYTGRLADPDMGDMYLSPALHPSSNFAGYANKDVDKLLLAARQTVDQAKRKDLYGQVQEIVAADVVYLYVAWLANHTVMNKRVQGYKPAPAYVEFWNADEWWIKPGAQ